MSPEDDPGVENVVVEDAKRIVGDQLNILFDHGVGLNEIRRLVDDRFTDWQKKDQTAE